MVNIRPNLWFDTEAEEAARFYVSVFKNAKLGPISKYPAGMEDVTGKPAGSVMTAEFEIEGIRFIGINGGPEFKFNEAVSFEIICEDQAEVDYYWEKLGAGGDPAAQVCGWLKDKYGVSWQVTPKALHTMLDDPDEAKRQRVWATMLQMKKIEVSQLEAAYNGVASPA